MKVEELTASILKTIFQIIQPIFLPYSETYFIILHRIFSSIIFYKFQKNTYNY